jgi:two-component system chemotaxis response regulator CheB
VWRRSSDQALRPTVTLDIEMPRLDGLGALQRIMEECPTRVVMVSSLTREGADATLRALELGAIDFIEKPTGVVGTRPTLDIANAVGEKVRSAAQARVGRRTVSRRPAALEPPSLLRRHRGCDWVVHRRPSALAR